MLWEGTGIKTENNARHTNSTYRKGNIPTNYQDLSQFSITNVVIAKKKHEDSPQDLSYKTRKNILNK